MLFGLFGNAKKTEVNAMLRLGLASALSAHGENANPDSPGMSKLAKQLVKNWLNTLPPDPIKNCSPSSLAAYIMVAEAQVHAAEHDLASANLYVRSAKDLVQGIGLRLAAGTAHADEITLMQLMAKIANKSGLSFYSELLDEAV
jgi:hypothetical protein